MANIDRAFILVGLGWLILGMFLGFYMGATGDNRVLDTHVAMLLPGFVVLTVYGVLYRLWPALKEGVAAKAQFWIAVIGSAGLVAGAFQLSFGGGPILAGTASALEIIAAVLMGWLFWTRAV